MKLIELEINNLRGIPNLHLKPNGKNFVILGPNGSGKSAIVDSIDFLLTGQISRLMGKGTKYIKLKDHGPHINSGPEDVLVRGLIEIPGFKEPIEIKRSMDKPKTLIYDKRIKSKISPLLDMASRGQHVLTRRDILNYVIADASTRSKQIQNLLKITEVEKIRQNLAKVRSKLKNSFKLAERPKTNAEANINVTIGELSFDTQKLLEIINDNRRILGKEPLFEIKSSLLRKDIKAIDSSAVPVNIDILESDIQNIREIFSNENNKIIFCN